MIPRLGDGNILEPIFLNCVISLENDSPSRGRKLLYRYNNLLDHYLYKFRK